MFINDDDIIEFFDCFPVWELIEEELDFFSLFGSEVVALSRGHTGAGTGTDGHDFFGLGADVFYFLFVFEAGDGALDEGNIKFIQNIFGLEDFGMANVEYLSPQFEVVIEEFGEHYRTVFTTREREPTDSKLFSSELHRIF